MQQPDAIADVENLQQVITLDPRRNHQGLRCCCDPHHESHSRMLRCRLACLCVALQSFGSSAHMMDQHKAVHWCWAQPLTLCGWLARCAGHHQRQAAPRRRWHRHPPAHMHSKSMGHSLQMVRPSHHDHMCSARNQPNV